MHEAITELHRVGYTISELCAVANISRQAYYKYLNRQPPQYEIENAVIASTIAELYLKYKGVPGYRMMRHLVNRQLNTAYGARRILRIMRLMGIQSVTSKKKQVRTQKSGDLTATNTLGRQFVSEFKNEKWLTDVTEYKLKNGSRVYMCAILDLFDNSIVAHRFSLRNNNQLVLDTFKAALKCNPLASPMVHSDRGYQFTSYGFRQLLNVNQMTQSMSRVGKCIDNGPMESFFGKLKSERYHLVRKSGGYATYQHLVEDLNHYIHFYNHERPQDVLFGLTPIELRRVAA
ncbi:IS3 family transposase [Jeotgalicoccus sp. S0W5]|uniref:IS3 family transposase n=1 Tax=Jeotgalicoccus sp. S0W5 TaxID=2527874 RepID=UPI001414F0A5|nr:IS3 family transposase [Jeotgalicoccus sp. S0W5]